MVWHSPGSVFHNTRESDSGVKRQRKSSVDTDSRVECQGKAQQGLTAVQKRRVKRNVVAPLSLNQEKVAHELGIDAREYARPASLSDFNVGDAYWYPDQSIEKKEMRVVIDLNKGQVMEPLVRQAGNSHSPRLYDQGPNTALWLEKIRQTQGHYSLQDSGKSADQDRSVTCSKRPQSAARVRSARSATRPSGDAAKSQQPQSAGQRRRPRSALLTKSDRDSKEIIIKMGEQERKVRIHTKRVSSAPRTRSQKKATVRLSGKSPRHKDNAEPLAAQIADQEHCRKKSEQDGPTNEAHEGKTNLDENDRIARKSRKGNSSKSARIGHDRNDTSMTHYAGNVFCVRGRTQGGLLFYLQKVLNEQEWTQADFSMRNEHAVFTSLRNSGKKFPRSLFKCNLLLSAKDGDRALYDILREPQFKAVRFNHFEKNDEITTKRGLVSNLPELAWSCGVSPEDFYPRCYSLGSDADVAAFTEDFRRTAAGGVLKLFTVHGEECSLHLSEKAGFTAHDSERIVRLAVNVCERHLEERLGICDGGLSVSAGDWALLEVANESLASAFSLERSPSKPVSSILVEQARRLSFALGKHDPQWAMDGCRNIWMITPSDKNNGVGVELLDTLDKIVTDARRMSGTRIVQKYVEDPVRGLAGQKVALRVSVLVTSWDPLQVWVYHPFYCRVGGRTFSLHKGTLGSNKVHLCDDSARSHDAYITESELYQLLGFETEEERQVLASKVDESCVLAMRAGQGKVVHREGSFQVYGVDLVVDRTSKNVWLLEVTLSPGIKDDDDDDDDDNDKSSEIATSMCRGLYDILLNDDSRSLPWTSGKEQGGWAKVYDSDLVSDRDPWTGKDDGESKKKKALRHHRDDMALRCDGKRISRANVGRIDDTFKRQGAAQVLQRFAADAGIRWPIVRERRNLAAMAIQNLARVARARSRSAHLRRIKSCVRIQCALRCAVAQRKTEQLRCEKAERCAVMIQRSWLAERKRRVRALLAKSFNRWACRTAIRIRATHILHKALRAWRLRCEMKRRTARRRSRLTSVVRIQCLARRSFAVERTNKRRLLLVERREKLAALRRKAEKRLSAASLIRRTWRAYSLHINVAALVIQRAWLSFLTKLSSVRFLQRAWRRACERFRTKKLLSSALKRWQKMVLREHFFQAASERRLEQEIMQELLQLERERRKEQAGLLRKKKKKKKKQQQQQQQQQHNRQSAESLGQRKPRRDRASVLKLNRQRRLVPTSLSREELDLSESLRAHKLKRPGLPPPLFDIQ